MYVPGFNRMDDVSAMLDFMQRYSFGVLVSVADGLPVATHLPFTVQQDADELHLYSHLAVVNPQWKSLAGQESLVIFSGPHAYISPTHYESVQSVPTWNYIAVHAYGVADTFTADDAPQQTEAMLRTMMNTFEASYETQWDSLSDIFRERLKRGIVGLHLEVTQLQGKAKLSQNKKPGEQQHIAEALSGHPDTMVREIAWAMQALQPDED